MKKAKEITAFLLVLLIFVGVAWGIDKVYNESRTPQIKWQVIDSTTSADNEVTDLAVDERTYTTVVAAIAAASSTSDGDGEISIYPIPDGWNAIRLRCIGVADNGTVTYQIYLGTLALRGTDCELVNAGQLAFVIGTQVSTTSTYELADAVTVTPYCWPKSWGYATNPDTELVAEASIDLLGADILIAVPTTASCDAKLLGKGF